MRAIFQQDLEQVGDDLVIMAKLAREAMAQASRALSEGDLALAEKVITEDRAIDTVQDALDAQCVALLARQQPVATDLRVVVTGLRLSATIERMGDLARHIAEIARGRYPELAIPEHGRPLFDRIGAAANAVADDVVQLLEGRSVDLAHRIVEDDDLLDSLHKDTFRLVLAPSAEGIDLTAQQIVDVTLLGRYYERFGDHGVAVARRILFLVTGQTAFTSAMSAHLDEEE